MRGVFINFVNLHVRGTLLPPFSQANFDELQPETVNGQVLKYAKSVYQLEKGLPPNGVVPVLKAKVEEMKDKVRTVAKKNH